MTPDIEGEIADLRASNTRLRAEVESLIGFIDTLQALVAALDRTPEDSTMMGALAISLQHALEVLDAEHGALLVHDEDSDELVAVLSFGGDATADWTRSPAHAGLAGWVLERRKPVIANDASADDRFDAAVDRPPGLDSQSLLVVPMIGQDRAMGVLRIANKRNHGIFHEDDQALVILMARFAGELLLRMALRHGGQEPG